MIQRIWESRWTGVALAVLCYADATISIVAGWWWNLYVLPAGLYLTYYLARHWDDL